MAQFIMVLDTTVMNVSITEALLGPKLSERYSPRLVVQIGLGILAVAVIGVMSTISTELTGIGFGVSLAFFGVGAGLVMSQLGNVVMSSVPTSRISEVGGAPGRGPQPWFFAGNRPDRCGAPGRPGHRVQR